MKVSETNLGFLIEAGDYIALFGGQKANFANLKSSYEEYTFIRVKQTHSDKSVFTKDPALDYLVEADGHYTNIKKTALCVSSADCIPVLIFDPKTKYVAGIHAGWRGVANRIVPKTIQSLVTHGCEAAHMKVLIGPHIQMNSFEVGNDVRDEILSSIQESSTQQEGLYHRKLNENKTLVDLNQVMKTQLQECDIAFDNLYNLHIDTATDPRFHSYRRDKEKSGRQLSFICRP